VFRNFRIFGGLMWGCKNAAHSTHVHISSQRTPDLASNRGAAEVQCTSDEDPDVVEDPGSEPFEPKPCVTSGMTFGSLPTDTSSPVEGMELPGVQARGGEGHCIE